MKRIKNRIKKWWYGKDIFFENDSNDSVFFYGWYNKKHWSSKLIHAIFSFYIQHWKFIWELLIGVIVTILIARYFD